MALFFGVNYHSDDSYLLWVCKQCYPDFIDRERPQLTTKFNSCLEGNYLPPFSRLFFLENHNNNSKRFEWQLDGGKKDSTCSGMSPQIREWEKGCYSPKLVTWLGAFKTVKPQQIYLKYSFFQFNYYGLWSESGRIERRHLLAWNLMWLCRRANGVIKKVR